MDDRNIGRRFGSIWAGLFLLLVGGLLLLDQMGFPFPDWLFTWPILLIALGLFTGLRHGFRGGAWAIFILIGSFFLVQDNFPHIPLHRFLWPCVLIFIGLLIIMSPRRYSRGDWKQQKRDWKQQWREERWGQKFGSGGGTSMFSGEKSFSSENFVSTTAIFGGVHKKIVTKDFKGGDVSSFMGGTELDLSQADINGIVRLDVTQVMGGTKIIVPPHWEVRSEVTALFAGFEDKRQQPAALNPDKVLVLQGMSLFGGIELKNY